MSPFRISITGALVAIILFASTSATAQTPKRVVFTPYVGYFVPTSDVTVFDDAIDGSRLTVQAKQRSSPAFGMNMSYWLSDRAALEIGGVYAFSDVRGAVTSAENGVPVTESLSDNAYVMVGSAKLLMHLFPSSSNFNLRLGLGPAIIHRGGTAYSSDVDGEVTGLTNFGGAVSLCTRIPVSNLVGIRIRAEDLFYQTRLGLKSEVDGIDFKFDRKTQHDLLFSAGVQLFVNR